MQNAQKLLLPFSVLIAGALIAGTILFVNQDKAAAPVATGTTPTGTVATPIRGVQADDHIIGQANAPVVIVEYSDPECPFCKAFHQTMQQIIATYSGNKIAWVYRHFPIPQLHPKGPKEAEALECAQAQGGNDMFWKFTNKIYATTNSNNTLDDGVYNTPATAPTDPTTGKPYYIQKTPRSATDAGQLSDIAVSLGLDKTKFEDCLAQGTYAKRVQTDEAEAIAAGGNGTPFSVILAHGQQIPVEGAQPFDVMKGLLDSLLK